MLKKKQYSINKWKRLNEDYTVSQLIFKSQWEKREDKKKISGKKKKREENRMRAEDEIKRKFTVGDRFKALCSFPLKYLLGIL